MMKTIKETLELALEAMENMSTALREDDVLGNDIDMRLDAITALREALTSVPDWASEAIEQPAPVAKPHEQEPVAFLDWYDNAHWGNEDFKDGCWRAWDAALEHTSPPAQRKPLTDEQISLIAHNIDSGDWNDLNFKECWHEGFKAGFREAEIEHNIKGTT